MSALTVAKLVDSATGGTIGRGFLKGVAPKLAKQIWPYLNTGKNIRTKVNGASKVTSTTKAVNETDNIVNDTTDAMDTVKAVLNTAGLVLQAGGTALEIVTSLVQIGMAAYDYGSLDTYNASFNAAIAAANTPLTISGLQAMMNGSNTAQAYSYLSLMASTSPQALTPTLPPPAVAASVYESL
jgi:hypothetical protein